MSRSDVDRDLPVTRSQVCYISDDHRLAQQVDTVLEEPLVLEVNGRHVATLMRLPGMEKELAVGYCLSEGTIRSFADILLVHHCGQGLPLAGDGAEWSRNRVSITASVEGLGASATDEIARLVRSGCGRVELGAENLSLPSINGDTQITASVLAGLGSAMRAGQRVHKRTGGLHAAAIFDCHGNAVVVCKDIGRHNALDKAAGYCSLLHIPLTDKVVLCSGRLGYEMATKCVRLGVPILASVSAPTSLAVEIAERCNLTLLGYVRGRRMTVYSHPWWVS